VGGGGVDLVVMAYIKYNKTLQSFVYELTWPNEGLQKTAYIRRVNKQTHSKPLQNRIQNDSKAL